MIHIIEIVKVGYPIAIHYTSHSKKMTDKGETKDIGSQSKDRWEDGDRLRRFTHAYEVLYCDNTWPSYAELAHFGDFLCAYDGMLDLKQRVVKALADHPNATKLNETMLQLDELHRQQYPQQSRLEELRIVEPITLLDTQSMSTTLKCDQLAIQRALFDLRTEANLLEADYQSFECTRQGNIASTLRQCRQLIYSHPPR